MGSLSDRNTEIMIAESQRMHAEVEALREMVTAQNLKVSTLVGEVAELKKAQVLSSVQVQLAITGSGGTAE